LRLPIANGFQQDAGTRRASAGYQVSRVARYGEGGEDGAVVGGEAPVGEGGDVGLRSHHAPGHGGAGQDVVDARVGVFHTD